MAADNYCRWCGKKYDWLKSTASDRGYFCCKRCEVAAHRAGAAPSGRSFESHLDSCMPRCIILFLVFALIYGLFDTCIGGNDKKDKNQDKKATQRTEQRVKSGRQKKQAARKSVNKVEPMDETIQTEEALQLVPEETSGTAGTDEDPMIPVDSLSEGI